MNADEPISRQQPPEPAKPAAASPTAPPAPASPAAQSAAPPAAAPAPRSAAAQPAGALTRLVGIAPIGLLVVVWLVSGYRAGGYVAQKWMPLALLIAFAALVVAAFHGYGRPPSRRLLAVLGFFALYVLWMALSTIWAVGTAPAWEESARAGFYLVFFALALVYLSDHGHSLDARLFVLVAAVAVVVAALVRWALVPDLATDFLGNRYIFPLTYPNGAGSFYLLLVWPLLWLAADPRGRSWARAVALGSIAPLLQLGILTQSRGAVGAFVLSAVVYFILSPARLRSLLFLAVPVALAALAFSPLTAYYTDGPTETGRALALYWMLGSWVGGMIAGAVWSLVDRGVSFSPRVRAVVTVVAIVAVAGGAALGGIWLDRQVGGLGEWLRSIPSTFTKDAKSQGIGGSRLGEMGGSGRAKLWETGWQGFLDSPVIGNGPGTYSYINELHRESPLGDAKLAHSIELDLLGDTGIVGTVLFVAAFGGALVLCVTPRFRSWGALVRRQRPFLTRPTDAELGGGPGDDQPRAAGLVADQAWTAALLAALALWFIHASVEWLWHLPGVTLGALLLLGYALSTSVRTGAARVATLFRVALGVVAVAVLIGVALPYLSVQYQNTALARTASRPASALAQAGVAHTLYPVSPQPFSTRAYIYRSMASDAESLPDPAQRADQTVAALALAVAAQERAVEKDRDSSLVLYQAGVAALNLLAAREAMLAFGDAAAMWAGLGAGSELGRGTPVDPGSYPFDAAAAEEVQRAGEIVALTDAQLLARARARLEAALMRSPGNVEVTELLGALGVAAGADGGD